MDSQNITLYRQSYNTVMNCTANSDHWEPSTYFYFDRMISNNIKPNLFTFKLLLKASGRSGDIVLANKYFEMMKEYKIEEDREIYSRLINVYKLC